MGNILAKKLSVALQYESVEFAVIHSNALFCNFAQTDTINEFRERAATDGLNLGGLVWTQTSSF